MLTYHFLLDLAIILLSTKALGIVTKKIHMPQVVGALAAGVILGPAVFGIVHETNFIKQLAEIGVIVLMFSAGLETKLSELKKSGKASIIIALFGVGVPLIGGFCIASLYNGGFSNVDMKVVLENVFIGVVLTATSVSITVETLRELGKLKTGTGTAILGAAIIDDILGIIILTIIMSTRDTSVNISVVLIKILMFFIVSAVIGFGFYYIFSRYSQKQKERRRFVIISFVFCLLMSYIAEHFFGVADITGAFIAGVVISNTKHNRYIMRRFEITSYMLLSPIFFASIGISIEVEDMNTKILIFTAALLVIAILSKVIGCGLGAKLSKYSNQDAVRIGVGMVSRGEVALIVATKGASVGLMKAVFFGPVIIVVVITTLITPVLLKLVYGDKNKA